MTAQDALYEWLQDRPTWQQELARRLLTQTELTPGGLEEILALVIQAAEGRPATISPPLRREEFPTASRDPAPRLTSVGDLVGVAAAAPGERIQFEADGLSVVYGANGAGKSTYVRVLKRVLRSVDRDDVVRGDVYADSVSADGEAAATFTVLRSFGKAEHRVDLHDPQDLGLETISVFDTGSAELYLGASNEIAYVPMAVRLLARMAATQDKLRSQLETQRTAEAQKRPDFSAVPAPSEAARRLEGLGASTDIDELVAFASLNDHEQRRLNELSAALASAQTEDVRADAESAAQDASDAATIRRSLNDLVNALSPESLTELRTTAQEARAARDAVAEAATAIHGMAEGVGDETWMRMWAAARAFAKPHRHPFPPSEGEVCLLCLRPIDASTSSRMDQLEDYVTSELQRQADQADEALQAVLERVKPARVDDIRPVISRSLREKAPELADRVDHFLDQAARLLATSTDDPEHAESTLADDVPHDELAAWERQRHDHAKTLTQSLDREGHAQLANEARELAARQALSQRIDAIREWTAALERIKALETAHSSLATNSLTRKQRELSESLVTDLLARTLEAELTHLRCRHLPVNLDPHTSVGTTNVALQLAGAYGGPALGDVLSEGEQRALALAFFLAEVGCAEHDGGIVLDDPVSSLDDERRYHIAQRLVEEANRRQVVVFTHDLPFLLELNELARSSDVPCTTRNIWRYGPTVGRVDADPPFSALNLRKRVTRLTQRVQAWDQHPEPRDEDEAWRRVCDVYRDMRVSWELATEERLFQGVVQRFQREVKTLKLRNIEVRDEWVEAINEGMTRCSYFVHDAPAGTRTAIPDRSEIEGDLQLLQDFERATRT